MDVPKHIKVRSFIPQQDGSTVVQTDTYAERPASFRQEIMKHERTSRETLIKDIISALRPMTSELTKELTITIKADDYYYPNQLTYTYTSKKEVYKPR